MAASLTSAQKKTVVAAFLGWMLDAFDFFILVFLLKDIAKEFDVPVSDVSYAIFLTLAMRFVGAFLFGRLGDRFGRRPILMWDVALFAVIGTAAAFAPTLAVFLVLRALFGIAMGGEWGLGSSLTMESIPPQARGLVSGILQCGYPAGYFLAAIAFGSLYQHRLFGFTMDWRGMFLLSIIPAFVVLFIRRHVPESPAFEEARKLMKPPLMQTLAQNWKITLYAVLLMMCFNFFSHGTQDMYPTFLQKQMGFDASTVSWITIVANLGAIAGGLFFGYWSERIGRVRAITIASLLVLPALPLWAYSHSAVLLALGAFIVQVGVQGAWGVIPAHLNELSPGPIRATLPGFVYQAGNFLASYNGPFQANRRVPRRGLSAGTRGGGRRGGGGDRRGDLLQSRAPRQRDERGPLKGRADEGVGQHVTRAWLEGARARQVARPCHRPGECGRRFWKQALANAQAALPDR